MTTTIATHSSKSTRKRKRPGSNHNGQAQKNKEKLEEADKPLIKEGASVEDMTQIDKSLEPVEGMNFVVEKLPVREKASVGTKIRNRCPMWCTPRKTMPYEADTMLITRAIF